MVVLLLLLQAAPAHPEMHWSRGNVIWGATATAAIAADCGITHQVLFQPMPPGERAREKNIFLGPHPSAGALNRYCVASVLGTWGVAHLLPSKARKYWFGAVALASGIAAVRNLRNLR